jgi:serine/threonine-protein kinase
MPRPLSGRAYPLVKDLTTVGSLASCDVQVLDGRAGPVHCQLRQTGALVTVVDLGGPGGTMVNGEPITDRLLAFGDRLRVADTEFVYEAEAGERGIADLVPGYEVLAKLGEGGMGYVFKARQLASKRLVALKVLAPRYTARPRHVEQFHREAELARNADHPNMVKVIDVGAIGNVHYFAMELLDGETCQQRLDRDGPFAVSEVVRIGRAVARALHHLHQRRLLHRDIKPDNIMLCHDGTIRLTDLGIAADLDRLASEGGVRGRIVGTPHYLAPEVAGGGEPDGRADLYGLGCTIFHLLAGATPFRDGDPASVIAAHMADPIPSVTDIRPDVPRGLEAIAERLMAKRREDRFPDAGRVAELFAALEQGETIDPFAGLGDGDPPTAATIRRSRPRRGRRVAWVAAAVAVITVLLVVWRLFLS